MISNNSSRNVVTATSPLSKDYGNVGSSNIRPLPARRNFYSTATPNTKVIEGVPSYIMATKVQLYRSYKVDLTWKRAVHSCSRCPKAQLNTISLVTPYPTHSDSVNRFCPAGVHMGHCTPVSEILHHHTIHRQSLSFDKDTQDSTKVYNDSQDTGDTIYSYAPPKLPHPRSSLNNNTPVSKTGSKEVEITIRNHTPKQTNDTQIIKDYKRDPNDSPPLVKAEVDIEDEFETQPRPPRKLLPETEDPDEKVFSFGKKKTDSSSITNSESSNVSVKLRDKLSPDKKDDYRPATPQRPEMRTRRGVVENDSSTNSPQFNGEPINKSINDSLDGKVDPDVPLDLDKDLIHETPRAQPTPQTTRQIKEENETKPQVNKKPEEKSSDPSVMSRTTAPNKENKVPILNFNTITESLDDNKVEVEKTPSSPPPPIKTKPRIEVPEVPEKPKIFQEEKEPSEPRKEKSPTPPSSLEPAKLVSSYDVIPRFHFPSDKSSLSAHEIDKELLRITKEIETSHTELEEAAKETPSEKAEESPKVKPKKRSSDIMIPYEHFEIITKALGVSLYWKRPIYLNCGGDSETEEPISLSSISSFWKKVLANCSDMASKFIYVLTNGKSKYLESANFEPVIYDIIYTHPGLKFLKSAPDFHHKYVSTVIARIFFCTNSSWSGRISLRELRNSNFLKELQRVADEMDINLVTQYFSYEHFYVIYCRFWELDTDHDLIINKEDLKRHNNYAISERMIDRIFSGAVTNGKAFKEGIMTYTDFVWFLIAEEDKRNPRSIEYWFRCMDLDGDGVLSMYELEYFYTEQLQRMEEFGTETISFQDTLCQCLDMVKPELGDKIRLSDLKKCKLCHIFFDIFFNVQKVIRYDTRDPFTNLRDEEDIQEGLHQISDWDRYADEAYELLTAIECSTDGNMNYEDDEEEFEGVDSKPEKTDSPNNEE